MKLTIIRTDKKKQKHITHKKLGQFAELIAQQQKKELLEQLRLIVRIGNEQLPIKHELPYVYPVVEMARNASGNPTMKALNGLVLLTSRKLEQAEQAELLKQRAMSMPSTAATFIGASNRTVKVLVSVKRANGELPGDEEAALTFHQEAYRQVFEPYNALMGNTLERRKATLHDRFCMTYDAHPLVNEKAVAFVVNEGLPAAIVKEAKQDSVSGFEPNEQVATETKAMVNRLQELFTFRFNEVMGCTEYRPRDERTDFRMADRSAMSDMALQLRLDGIDARENDVRRFLESSMISHFDPLDEYLWKVHDKWDGKDHIGALARTVKTDNPHWEEWFRRWFVAMVAQWRGGKLRRYGNAYMPLLISRQGYNKSTFCKSLIPEELQWGYTPSLSLQEKRPVLQAMSQFLLINLDEFNSIPVNIQQGFLKNIVSLSSVKVKRPYGRRMEDFPRLASFIATANMTDLLADPSGSRRFLSVELTGPIDVSNVPYHEQLYAQAQALIDSGYRYWFTKEEEREIMENNRQFQLRSPAEELLNEYFEITYDENEGTYLSPSAIFTYLKEKAGSSLRVTNIRSLGRMLANMEGIRRRRVNAGTQYLLKKRPK